MKGKLIVIEGTDGSGKTTQTELLMKRLRAGDVLSESIRFPQYGTNIAGTLIRESLDGKHGDFTKVDPKIGSVLYAVDRFETMPKMRGWISEGKIIVADRYTTSNQIHQGGKLRSESDRVDFLNWLSALEYDALCIMKPDIVFYLDMPFEESLNLISKREGIKDAADSDFEYLKNSKEAGKYMVERESFWERVECMDGDKLLSPEEIHEKIWKKIIGVIK
jgi:dTMP kinase